MRGNDIIFRDVEFWFQGEKRDPYTRTTTREYVVWEGKGDDASPVDRFVVFRNSPAEPWLAWTCDTLSIKKTRRRRAFERYLRLREQAEARARAQEATARRDAALAADGRDHSARAVLARLPVINDPVISAAVASLEDVND